MKELGRKGGLRGGPARAKKLDSSRLSEIAKKAAIARWLQTAPALGSPRNLDELRYFVAQYEKGRENAEHCDPVGVLIRALSACRKDAAKPQDSIGLQY